MSSGGGTDKKRGNQAGGPKHPWNKKPPGNQPYNVAQGKQLGSPRPSVGSPRASPGGKLSSFMQPTAASSSKAKATADAYMNNHLTGVSRSPAAAMSRSPAVTATTKAEGHPSAVPAQKSGNPSHPQPRERQSGQELHTKPSNIGIEDVKNTQKFVEYTLMQPSSQSVREQPSRPSTSSSYGLLPGLGLNFGHLVTPPEFYNRPPSSVGVHIPDNQEEHFDPEWLGDLKRMVLELGLRVRNESIDNGSMYGGSQYPSRTTTMLDSDNGQSLRIEGHNYQEYLHGEFQDYKSHPDPTHNLVIIVGPHNIGFSLNGDVILDHSPVIADLVDKLETPAEGEIRELLFPDLDPYGFFYILKALFTSTFPTVETAGRRAEALMLDAALALGMNHIVIALRHNICDRLRAETLDIEVGLRFANSMFKYSTQEDMRDFWHEDAFVRCALRQTTIADLIERSPSLFDDRTWIVPGFKHELIRILERTHLRI
ncbi:hypothetical protein TWF281_003747 [Arthrobotrys megalospora]